MQLTMKRLFQTAILNSSLFMILIIGIQNSSNKSKINLLLNETINLPISFIIGSSFIMGSITGDFLSLHFIKKEKS